MSFKIGDRIIHTPSNRIGTVNGCDDDRATMSVKFDNEDRTTLCVNSEEWFKLAYEMPSEEKKSEWADLWDKASE